MKRGRAKAKTEISKAKTQRTKSPAAEDRSSTIHRIKGISFGRLVKPPKWYVAEVILDGAKDPVRVHCPNTGPQLGLLEDPEPPSILLKSNDPKRRCQYTLEAVQIQKTPNPVWMSTHSSSGNKMVEYMLKHKMIPDFAEFDDITAEASYGSGRRSRADFLLVKDERRVYVEVKAVTYSEQRGDIKIGLFPANTKSPRAHKHLEELTELVSKGDEAAVILLVMGNECSAVGPFKENDPKFASLMKAAHKAGVRIVGIGLQMVIDEKEKTCDYIFKRFLDVHLDPPDRD